jgi:hypothetical protein
VAGLRIGIAGPQPLLLLLLLLLLPCCRRWCARAVCRSLQPCVRIWSLRAMRFCVSCRRCSFIRLVTTCAGEALST